MDHLSPKSRSRLMARIKSAGTTPERIVLALVRSLRYAVELNCRELPGRPDIVFRRRRKILFVHGCFWHSHHCRAGQNVPRSRKAYWTAKRLRNHQRDLRVQRQLRHHGWSVKTIWECQLHNPERLAAQIHRFLQM